MSTTTTSMEGRSGVTKNTISALWRFRRVVMHYRKNHNSVTGPTWKYPRYKRVLLYFLDAFKHVTCRFSEFVDYVLGKDLRYDDEHWAPFFKECTPCHINFTFIGQYLVLDTWEWPVDEDASFTFDRVDDSALLCTCHQATLRLSTGIFTFWQTKLASLNGTTRM